MRAPLTPLFALLAACPAEPDATTLSTYEDTGSASTRTYKVELAVTLIGADDLSPHGDGSGLVEFVATATDAVRFTFDLGNGTRVDSVSGQVQHTYDELGTNDFVVTVTAHWDTETSEEVTETITVYRTTGELPTLVWSDEFDGDGAIDADKWHHQDVPPQDGGWFNGELQHYTARTDNSYVSDGTLKIAALDETYIVHGSVREYTSARLNSKFAFTYGRVEVRAKLPAQAGTWPAIWTLGANIDEIGNHFGSEYGSVGWPACGEIDILEQRGWDKQSTISHFHWGNTQTAAYENEGGELANPTSTTDFHVYSLEWTEDHMRVMVDDQLVHELANTVERPFDNPHYLLLNIAMGGSLGGAVPDSFTQAVMEVDYVRVYQ